MPDLGAEVAEAQSWGQSGGLFGSGVLWQVGRISTGGKEEEELYRRRLVKMIAMRNLNFEPGACEQRRFPCREWT